MYRLFILVFISSLFSQAILHSPIEEATEKTPILIEAFIDLPDYEIKKVDAGHWLIQESFDEVSEYILDYIGE